MVRWQRFGGVALVLGVLASLLSGCVGSSGPGGPPGSLRVPVQIIRSHNLFLGAMVEVRVRGKPYLFRVDSGAGRTFVASSLAAQLGLGPPGPPQQAETIGCLVTGREATISDWSLGGHPLPTQPVVEQALTGAGNTSGGAPYAGLLGSDVLSRFGAIRLDVKHATLTLGGSLRAGAANSAPVTVIHPRGDTLATATVAVGGQPAPWVVDTGAGISFLSAGNPQADKLDIADPHPITIHSPTCTSSVQLANPAPWMVGSVALPNGPIVTGPSHLTFGPVGLLGDDIIGHFGSVTIDYAHGHLSYGD